MAGHGSLDYEGDTDMTGEEESMELRHGKKVKYGNLEILRKDLGFASVRELKEFWWSLPFWGPFSEYAMVCVWPQRKVAYDTGNSRGPGKHLETIQGRLSSGQIDGTMRYSDPYADTSEWTDVDYAARLLWKLRNHATHSADGMFYGKHMSENEIDSLIWNLWKHVEYSEAPSRRSQRSKDTERALRQASMNPLAELTTKPVQSAARPKIFLKFPPRLITSASESVVESAGVELDLPIRSDEVQQPIITDVEGKITPTLTNGQKMALENGSSTPNMRYRWWQAWAGMEGTKVRAESDFVVEDDPIRKLESLQINFQQMRNEEALEIDPVTAQIDDLHLATQRTPEQAALDFKQTQSFLHSTEYQRENLEEACRDTGIEWHGADTIFRIPGMKRAWTLRFWQVVGICALLDFQVTAEVGACILGDVVGMGKTWMIIGLLLVVSTLCTKLQSV